MNRFDLGIFRMPRVDFRTMFLDPPLDSNPGLGRAHVNVGPGVG